jgi:LssY C-terminus
MSRFQRIVHKHATVHAGITFWVERDSSVGHISFERHGSRRNVQRIYVKPRRCLQPVYDCFLDLLFAADGVSTACEHKGGNQQGGCRNTQHVPIIAAARAVTSDIAIVSISLMKFSIALVLVAATAAWATTIPAGTDVQVRLTSEASSEKPSGQPVSGVVIAPVVVNGAVAISPGTQVTGKTADAIAFQAGSDQVEEKAATVRIQFTKIEDASGHSKPLEAVVKSVDNARESVDTSGLITGIVASKTYEAQIEKGISKLEAHDQGFANILSAVKGAMLKQVDASIDYKPGVELTLKLTKPLEWSAPTSYELPEAVRPPKAVVDLVNSEPFRTVAQSPPRPSDVTTLMFIGSAEQLQSTFQEAGWYQGNALSRSSKFETARAMIESRGYNEAPMSILYLEGRPPDFTFEKQNNTFAMRHHIRIWRRPETYDGKPVWVAAATHDVSITMSSVSHSFTHGIDPHIDVERAKVAYDLLFTGRARALGLAARSNIPRDISNATGDKLITDGKMAVLEF